MDDLAVFRRRLAAAGVALPEELMPLVAVVAGPMVEALDELAASDFGTLEPFDPARVLVRDADR